MIDDGSGGYLIGGAGGGLLAMIAQQIWAKVFSTEGKANDLLVQQMSDQIKSLSERQDTFQVSLDTERKLRRAAEEKVHLLELYVVDLKGVLRQHNIEAPPLALPATPDGVTA